MGHRRRFSEGEWSGLAESVAPHVEHFDAAERARLRDTLFDDMTSEYDARFFSEYIRSLDVPFTPAFWRAERQWAADEASHYTAVRTVVERLFGVEADFFARRRPDFGPLAHLFVDELSVLCLGAYDELATVRGYRANLPMYERLGPRYAQFVRHLIADEASHYAAFLRVIIDAHPHRLDDALRWIDRIREIEGVAYSATFVLDHDDPVYSDELFDDAARVLRRQLVRALGPRTATPFGRAG